MTHKWSKKHIPRFNSTSIRHIRLNTGIRLGLKLNNSAYFFLGEFLMNSEAGSSYSPKFAEEAEKLPEKCKCPLLKTSIVYYYRWIVIFPPCSCMYLRSRTSSNLERRQGEKHLKLDWIDLCLISYFNISYLSNSDTFSGLVSSSIDLSHP